MRSNRNFADGRNTISQVPENRRQVHYILNGGVDWNLEDKNTLTFSGIYDFERHVDTAQVAYIDQNAERRYRYYAWNEEEVTGYINLSAQYKHKFEAAEHTLDAGLQYTRGWEDETYSLNDSSAIRQGKDKTNILAIEHTTTASIDYLKPLMSGRLEAGAKVRIRRLPVEYTTLGTQVLRTSRASIALLKIPLCGYLLLITATPIRISSTKPIKTPAEPPIQGLNLSLHRFDEKGELTFSISDMFYKFGIRQNIVEEAFTAHYENNYETQVMRIGFKYKF